MGADPRRLVCIGVVARAHGVRGEAFFRPEVQSSCTFASQEKVILRSSSGEPRDWKIASVRPTSGGVLVKFEGIADRCAAQQLVGSEVCLPRSALPPLEEGEFYFDDLIGLRAMSPQGVFLGKVASLIDTGAVPVLEISGEKELQIPLAEIFVKRIDLLGGEIILEPPLEPLEEES